MGRECAVATFGDYQIQFPVLKLSISHETKWLVKARQNV